MIIIRRYLADFPKWYVQAEQAGIRVELAFNHEPSDAEVQAVMDDITTEPETTVELVGENGQVI